MIEPNTQIKIECSSDGALHLSMWRYHKTRGGLAVTEELPQTVHAALTVVLRQFLTKALAKKE